MATRLRKADGKFKKADELERPYKVYSALLQQDGTGAPVATVLENTIGSGINWLRFGAGNYVAEKIGAFPVGKTMVFIGAGAGTSHTKALCLNNASQVSVRTFTSAWAGADEILGNFGQNPTPFEIRVYP